MRTLVALLLLALLPTALTAVSALTVTGNYPGQYPTPGNLTIQCDSPSGGRVQLMCIIDSNANGHSDPGEPLLWSQVVQDNGVNVALPKSDQSDVAGVVQFTWQTPLSISGPVVFRAQDADGVAAEQGCTLTATAQGQTFSGTVYDSTGAGVGGVIVQARHGDASLWQAVTAADGRYTVTAPPGLSEITVLNPDNLNALRACPARYVLPLRPGETRLGVSFSLPAPAGSPFTGKVTCVGVPLPGSIVYAQAGEARFYAQTDVNGDYTLYLPAGSYSLTATPPSGWEPYAVGPTITVPPATYCNIDLPANFACTHYLIGWVHDGVIGVGGATAQIYGQQHVLANVIGVYEMWVSGRSTLYTLYPTRPGWSALNAERYQGACDTTTADLAMHQNMYQVHGAITETGLPAGSPATAWLWGHLGSDWTPGGWGVFSDEQGNYALNLPAGTWSLAPWSFGTGAGGSTSVTLPPAATANVTLPAGFGAPSLSSWSVTPTSGLPDTHYVYRATYTDPYPGRQPDQVCVLIDDRPYALAAADAGDTNCADGKVYTFTYTGPALSMGDHSCRFVSVTPQAVSVVTPGITGPLVGDGQPFLTLTPGNSTVRGLVHLAAAVDMGITGDTVSQVDFTVDGILIGADATAPYTCDWDTWAVSVADGPHTVRATAHRSSGGSFYAQVVLTADNTTFDDVPKTSGQWEYIEAIAREAITSGCSQTPRLYCPASSVTRAQMAVFLCRAAGWSPYNNATPTFADVPKTSGFYGYIEEVYRRGVTAGCGGAPLRFCPDTAVTRGQMAVFLCRAAGLPTANPATPSFTDVPKTSQQYTYVEGVYQAGVTAGCVTTPPKQYCPSSPVTRGQMAVFLVRAFGLSLGP